jgi:hypothetical protein
VFTRLVNTRNVMGWGECVKAIRVEKKLKTVLCRISLSQVVGWVVNQSSLYQTNFSCTNVCSSLCGLMAFNCGAVRSRPIHKSYSGCSPKILRSITGAPWYVSNFTLHNDLHIPFVAKEARRLSHLYHHRLASHHNALVTGLVTLPPIAPRLKRRWPTDPSAIQRTTNLVPCSTHYWVQRSVIEGLFLPSS